MEGPGGILPTPADLFTRLSDEVVLHILSFVPWPDVHAPVTMKKRRRIIDELISTETFYIDSLVRALQKYTYHGGQAYAGKAKKTRWQQRWVDNHQAGVSVADCFQPLGHYCHYCLDYMAATQELMKKRHKFHHQPQPGQKPVLELAAYLVMPISRIPRYKLLLEELLKCTPPDHPEHDTLCKLTAEALETPSAHLNGWETKKSLTTVQCQCHI
ncbi:IQ calmodulinbinding domain containing protein [Acanthamoeba castellanii str. Neff]|uniref:IQ calmodulinbinding domain containing protein n=1 Tax=Acanthamoeba castellanii (strain ATCC 30010 / Neff) TaxID=1257118 RepID=L8H2G3_ACACF|nr:IQ calmodulinbinding domain containing protein [Acanthamoeba castellanii str. Neff]ELR19427.1 IQ calmodulinbinding domain containing protein [Acanthamoeba castellanii str. Neff]